MCLSSVLNKSGGILNSSSTGMGINIRCVDEFLPCTDFYVLIVVSGDNFIDYLFIPSGDNTFGTSISQSFSNFFFVTMPYSKAESTRFK